MARDSFGYLGALFFLTEPALSLCLRCEVEWDDRIKQGAKFLGSFLKIFCRGCPMNRYSDIIVQFFAVGQWEDCHGG